MRHLTDSAAAAGGRGNERIGLPDSGILLGIGIGCLKSRGVAAGVVRLISAGCNDYRGILAETAGCWTDRHSMALSFAVKPGDNNGSKAGDRRGANVLAGVAVIIVNFNSGALLGNACATCVLRPGARNG